jgi:hypothetical protein
LNSRWGRWLGLLGGIALSVVAAARTAPSATCRAPGDTIKLAGSYCLSGDLSSQRGIVIEADDVTVDLAGYCLTGPGTPDNSATGILISGPRKNVAIKNGCITGYMYGLQSQGGSREILVEKISFRRNTFRAALMESDDLVVKSNIVDGVGGTSVYADAYTMGLDLRGKRTVVSDNEIREVYPDGSGDSVGISIGGADAQVTGNTLRNNDRPLWGRSYCIAGQKDTVATRNSCHHMTYGFSGLSADGNSVSEEDCAAGSTSCPDNIAAALDALSVHDADDGRRLFRVGRAYHKARDYPSAAIYYLAAARKGIAEGNRIVERHLKFGYITPDDKLKADRESLVLAPQ